MAEERPNPESDRPSADQPLEGDHDALTSELVAYLDGELDREESEVVGTKISLDPAVRAEADALKKTWDLLDHLPRPEPSPNFTQRTISQIQPVMPSPSGQAPARSGAPATIQIAPAPTGPLRHSLGRRVALFVAWLIAMAAVAFGGYFGRDKYVGHMSRLMRQEQDAQIPSELRLLQNLKDFRYVDDLEFLEALDNPDLFGEEQTTPMNEGAR
jgi:hypothetical protein